MFLKPRGAGHRPAPGALIFDSTVSASQYFKLKSHSSISLHLDKYTTYKKRYQIVSDNEFLKFFPDVEDTKYYCDLNKLPLVANL